MEGSKFRLELRKLEVSPIIRMIMELGVLLYFLEKVDDHNEDVTNKFLERYQGGSVKVYKIMF